MGRMALEWRGVSFSVRHGFWMSNKEILKSIDLQVPEGAVVGLIGPNGAGKTTTIKLGAGLLEPEVGEILITGKSAREVSARTSLGLLTESQYIYPHLKFKEWLAMLGGLTGLRGSGLNHRINHVIELLELEEYADRLMRTFSKGEIQRAGLAQALLHEPAILLLDEPMSGLDPYWRYQVNRILLELKSAGTSILFSSHILADVERICDEVALLDSGKIHWKGALSDLPRKIKGYEAICRTDHPEVLEVLIDDGLMTQNPEGSWSITIAKDEKDPLLRLTSDGKVRLDSLRPVREEIEEVLFGFVDKHPQSENVSVQ